MAGGRAKGQPFVGRADSLARLEAALAESARGRPSLFVVEGEAGTGKTTLVRRFIESHAEARVLECAGSADEQLVSYGVAGILLRRLSATSGRGSLSSVVETSDVGGRLLSALPTAGGDRPTLLVIDDAQWVDRPSLQALVFVLRRLEVDPVLAIIASRPPLDPALERLAESRNGDRLVLRSFGAKDVQDMGAQIGLRLSRAAAARLTNHTGGLPLHVNTLLGELGASTLTRSTGPLPAPRSFATIILQRLAAAPAETELLVTAAAVLGNSCPLPTAAAVAAIADPLEAVDGGVQARLIRLDRDSIDGDRLVFVHSLVRAAVLDAMAPARRADLHRRAAATLTGVAALDHLASATLVPDRELARQLTDAGKRELECGEVDRGVHHLLTAAGLTADALEARQLRLDALEALVLNGANAEASGLADDIGLDPARPADDAQVAYALGHLELVNGRRLSAERLLKLSWDLTDLSGDRPRAALTALRIAQLVGIFSTDGRQAEAVEWAERALAAVGDHPVFGRPVSGIGAVSLVLTGRAEEAAARALPDHLTARALADGYTDEVLARGIVRLWTDELEAAAADLAHVAYPAGFSEPLQTRLFGLGFLADSQYRLGHWDDALAAAEGAIALAEDADHIWLLGLLHAVAARPRAARGEWDAAVAHIEAANLAADLIGDITDLVFAADAAAALAAARDTPLEVIAATDALAELDPAKGGLEPGFLSWPFRRAEAFVAVDRLAEAADLLDTLADLARDRGRRSALASISRSLAAVRAAAGDHASAVATYEEGLALCDQMRMPFEKALVHLSYGTHLRRQKKRKLAAGQLQVAIGHFSYLGARPYRERAEEELAACGLSPRRRQPGPQNLTPREQAVGRLVASGLTNPEIAERLFLSVKTVEYHLGNVFAKLGVRNRAELAGRLGSVGPVEN